LAALGCSGGPDRFDAPSVDTDAAAAQAMELYDENKDGKLDKEELVKVPGILVRMQAYDANADGAVDRDEIAKHLGRLLNRTGGTQLSALVTHKGRPLSGATVTLEPESYLGEQIQQAQGVTDGSGVAELAIPPEYAPEHLRRLKTVHYGTFKVRITHPSAALPAKYNSATELGYETEPGKPTIAFALE
jgi:hypothetical protein